ncbi:MAG TPA: hypothetical protein VK634_14780 [Reyranella sp.]|nr:hypothetical protein [Reyranella sp.]
MSMKRRRLTRWRITISSLHSTPRLGAQCVYPAGELPGIWILYPNRRLLRRTRLFVDELAAYVRDEL